MEHELILRQDTVDTYVTMDVVSPGNAICVVTTRTYVHVCGGFSCYCTYTCYLS